MRRMILYVHGMGGNCKEAEHYKKSCPGFEVVGVDYDNYLSWIAEHNIRVAYEEARKSCNDIYVIANSIGAYFVMHSLRDCVIQKALFISPVLDMEKVITDMMSRAHVSEKDLREKEEIIMSSGEILSWKYLCFVRDNPIAWSIPTEILYAENELHAVK